ncbi:hypothetical protein [Hymenobacter koreensis]|uniref:Carboxypeptidase regulatory-like domain-containing protein n=1 Tax=Hymenobacter koreensis TaxID=1084523 RepID=A0ABP8IY70_9BACT
MPAASLLFYATLTLCLLLGVLLIWQAWRRPDRRRRVARAVAGIVASVALWFSVFPPHRSVEMVSEQTGILITPGTPADTLRYWQKRLGRVPVLRYTPNQFSPDSNAVTHPGLIGPRYPHLRQLYVLGQGIPATDAASVDARLQLVARPQWPAAGFRSANWRPSLALGEELRVEGRFAASVGKSVKLYLRAAGVTQDSVALTTGNGAFRLRGIPRAVGPQLLRLEAYRDGRLLAAEPVPVTVEPTRTLQVLILGGGPSFELNLLKNRLATRGHGVAQRLSISRNLRQTDFLNINTRPLATLTPAALARFDVLIADDTAWGTLTAAETRAVTQAAAQGLGLVALPGPSALPRTLPQRAAFQILPRSAQQVAQTTPVRWEGGSAMARLPATLKGLELETLVRATGGATVAAAYRGGYGTMVVATPSDTYRWLLAGQNTAYDSYWARLLTAAARPVEPASEWQAHLWSRPHQPMRLNHFGAGAGVQIREPDARVTSVGLRQLPLRSFQAEATFWPRQPGWHAVGNPTEGFVPFYVFDTAAWIGPEISLRAQALGSRPPYTTGNAPETAQMQTLIPSGWFFALFLLAAGFMWLEEKL